MEMLEAGTRCLLIDEDTSATNFMIRDARMQRLVEKGGEPITPFIDKVRPLYEERQVSTIMVIGGSGDYFDVADTVVLIDEFMPREVTAEAKIIAAELETQRLKEETHGFGALTDRSVDWSSMAPGKNSNRQLKIDAKGLHTIRIGYDSIELAGVEQLIDSSQTRAIANVLVYLIKQGSDRSMSRKNLYDQLSHLYEQLDRHGLDIISPYKEKHPGDLALPRLQDCAAAINRMRGLKMLR